MRPAPTPQLTPADGPPRTVLFIDHTAKISGGEIALLNLVECLDKRSYRPIVLLFSDGELRSKLDDLGIETHLMPLSKRAIETRKDSLGVRGIAKGLASVPILLFSFKVARWIRRLKPDIVHTNSLKADLIGGLAGRLAGVPVIWHVRDRIVPEYLPRAAVWLLRRCARFIPSFVVANSQSTLETIALPTGAGSTAIYSGVRVQFSVVHDGVHPRGLASTPSQASDPVVGLVGRLARWKGQDVFLRAAAIVRDCCPQARFQIIGSPLFGENDYELELHSLRASLGLTDVVEFTGFRPDVPQLVDRMAILVHASTFGEPFGQVVVEGMVAAKPVIATAGGGVPEIVVDGVTGLLVPMGDHEAMAKAIIDLLSDPDRADAMGKAGRQRVKEHFSIEHTAAKVQAVYEYVLSGGRRGMNGRPSI